MKALVLSMMLTPMVSYASHEVGIGYTRINHDLQYKVPISYKMDALQLSYGYHMSLWSNTEAGIRFEVRRTTESPNVYANDDLYEYKLDVGYAIKAGLRYHVTPKLSLGAYAGVCEQHNTSKVNGEYPVWSKGTNSHKPCYSFHVNRDIGDNWKISGFYGLDYEKDKENFGHKESNSLGIEIIKEF